jgi:hypothetical protein
MGGQVRRNWSAAGWGEGEALQSGGISAISAVWVRISDRWGRSVCKLFHTIGEQPFFEPKSTKVLFTAALAGFTLFVVIIALQLRTSPCSHASRSLIRASAGDSGLMTISA